MYKKLVSGINYLLTHPKRNKNKFLYFLVSIIILIIFIPFAERDLITAAFLNLIKTVIILTGVYAVSDTKTHIYIASALGIPCVLFYWFNLFIFHQVSGLAALSLSVLFFIYTTVLIFFTVIKGSRVTIETLFGAITTYLLIGLTYTDAYALIEKLHPGSFYMPYNNYEAHNFQLYELLYFSYVSLTTLGTGDIIPMNAPTRILSISEAIIGQLYLAILVARLVGLHIYSISKRG